MKTASEVEEVCRKLKPIIGSKADTLWYQYLAEDDRGRKDLALDIEIIAEKILKKDALSKQKILLNPPSPAESTGSFLLGDVIYNDKKLNPIYLRSEDFIKQIGIFAITGEGKTNLAYLLALQLLKSKVPFMVIDWKRSWRNLLSLKEKIPELEKVQVFTVGRDILPFLWNPFRPPPGADKELWISTISEALEKSHISGPGVAYYFNRIYSRLFKGYSPDFYPNFFDGQREIGNIRAFERELRWKQTALRIFNSFTLGCVSKAFNARNPIKLEHLLDKPVILELDLEMPKPLRIFFSEIILRWIHLYRLSQGETEKLRHVLFLEEVHNLFVDAGFNKENNNLENVYREIRAFGQGIISITQHPSLLPIYLLGNCHTQIYLGLQHADDIRTARKALFLKYDEESYPNMLNVGECIVKIKNRVDPCLVKTPLVPVNRGLITDDWLRENTPGYLPGVHDGNMSHKAGYLPADIYRGEGEGKSPQDKIDSHHRLLVDIFLNPLSGITLRYKKLNLNPKYGNKFKNHLISQGCIQPRKIITGKGWITLFELTKKGKAMLRDSGYEFKDTREGVVHKFWKHKIADYYRKQNLEVLIEEPINGRPDIIVMHEDKKVAVEIETGNSDAIGNIQKRLESGFDEIISIATNRFVEDKIMEELRRKNIVDERVKVTTVFGFDINFSAKKSAYS
jgi:hypothetical protein